MIPDIDYFSEYWNNQFEQYPKTGPKGISYFKGEIDDKTWVDCLLYRNSKGKLIGVLNHYPFNFHPYEKKGNINVMVDPNHQREGIGQELLKSAMKKWKIDFIQQKFTPQGYNMLMKMKDLNK